MAGRHNVRAPRWSRRNPAASSMRASAGGIATSKCHSSARAPDGPSASVHASHHGVTARASGSTTSSAHETAGGVERVCRSRSRECGASSLMLQANKRAVRACSRARLARSAASTRSPRRVAPWRPSVRHVQAASDSAQPLSSTPVIVADGDRSSAHAADAAPVPQPRSTRRSIESIAGGAGRAHDLARGQEMQRRVEGGEGRALAGRVERRTIGETGASLDVAGRERAHGLQEFGGGEVRAMTRLECGEPVVERRHVRSGRRPSRRACT